MNKKPIYEQIYEDFVREIKRGRYRTNERLPSVRQLAKDLGVSKTTVESAYALLISEGYIENIPSYGHIVLNIDTLISGCGEKSSRCSKAQNSRILYDFSYSDLSSESFPLSLWRRLTNKALLSEDIDKASHYGDKQGEPELRKEIAAYLRLSRGMLCDPDQIVITCGIQYSLDIIVKLSDKRVVAMEEPGYYNIRDTFINNGYEILPVPVEKDGIDLDSLRDDAGLVFTTPSHQMPTGAVMPYSRRKQLLEWAENADSYIIEDDYDHEFLYDLKTVQPLQSIDTYDRVIYLGTFSKVFSPALRLSYFVLPKKLLQKYHRLFHYYYCMVSWLQQRIITLYMAEGYWERRVNKIYSDNRRKRNAILDAVKQYMGEKVSVSGSEGGTHVVVTVSGTREQDELISLALQKGVKVYSTMPFWLNKDKAPLNSILLGFNAVREADVFPGIKLLNEAWF
ncbi:MAG TPA: PLP-dependent aminotransferase family protein [Deferribacteraceae bacterium]|nr:PLP-dependent aminotransferase family protein [Deferribacteraceae bacterium]